jgi:hypothetical protein
MYSVNLNKTEQSESTLQNLSAGGFDSAESFDPGFFNQELTTEGLATGCGLLVLKSKKRSVINIQCSMLDVLCSAFNLFNVPLRRNFI